MPSIYVLEWPQPVGAALSLLRHGDGQPGLYLARGVHRAAVPPVSTRPRRWRRSRASRSRPCPGSRPCFIAELGLPGFADYDLSSLRTGIMAGSPCPVEVMKQVVDQIQMSEASRLPALPGVGRSHPPRVTHCPGELTGPAPNPPPVPSTGRWTGPARASDQLTYLQGSAKSGVVCSIFRRVWGPYLPSTVVRT
jgi:hypothetical protein